ncbi:hypothetical protein HETIRDRAFT_328617 [Heterobasidion irregulare TC 32-1]|uniref:Uncharacterized protein n=1 Tax=Heterobasidion irregulare (strain TC 32-1) TaxID=747525 RepID=W4JV31_HETIT|nr:uncharacterized protein HETIRDRAFT_328617 [Heterobasidion irregulare TC 32-1]ETW76940.1 hypothetical protein HETIRDRAFT_328617 [Heterobasidion irregulare TC 32-1]
MNKILESASHMLTPFSASTVSVPYKDEVREFPVHVRPLWDWALDLLRDPQLASHFTWDAEKIFKFDGHEWDRVFHEPWTADSFWRAQSAVPETGGPFCIILYADKTKLSTFGTEKGYPVIARCANLPTNIRNGSGIGGGCVVGWLPIVSEDPAETHKTGFVNFKNAVWHKSFYVLLETIAKSSKIGFWFECADGVRRWLFPLILILSADYEEQCVMALIRGARGKCPCPICLVPDNMLSDLSQDFPLRTSENSQDIFKEAMMMATVLEKEELLKQYSLRGVENVFWSIANVNPYQVLSWDRLHAYHLGLFGDHLWFELKQYISDWGRSAESQVDNQAAMMPRWRNLNHFDEIMKISFSNGKKFEDISKIIIFITHNVFGNLQSHKPCYALLHKTIYAGEQELQRFGDLIQNYSNEIAFNKNWNFPKMHTHKHIFQDIQQKGVTRNYNTKPNEKLHGPLKDAYLLQSNKKEVASQLLQIDHHNLVLSLLWSEITTLDEEANSAQKKKSTLITIGNIIMGSRKLSLTFENLEATRNTDIAFKNFHQRFVHWLSEFLPSYRINLPNGKRVKLTAGHTIQEYQSLKVKYESMVDWRQSMDYLHCSPLFHGHPRYDHVIVQTITSCIFTQLVFLFTWRISDDQELPIALIHPLDAPIGALHQKDEALGFFRLHAKPRVSSEFIFVRFIIRGALVVQDFSKPGKIWWLTPSILTCSFECRGSGINRDSLIDISSRHSIQHMVNPCSGVWKAA